MVAIVIVATAACGATESDNTNQKPTVAIIGTGDMGDSLGPRFAEIGYTVVYGTRNPASERVLKLAESTAATRRARG